MLKCLLYIECRGIAAALLGDPDRAIFVPMPHSEQFQAVANGTVDLATDTTAVTAERDIYVEEGMTFTRPFLYTGRYFTIIRSLARLGLCLHTC